MYTTFKIQQLVKLLRCLMHTYVAFALCYWLLPYSLVYSACDTCTSTTINCITNQSHFHLNVKFNNSTCGSVYLFIFYLFFWIHHRMHRMHIISSFFFLIIKIKIKIPIFAFELRKKQKPFSFPKNCISQNCLYCCLSYTTQLFACSYSHGCTHMFFQIFNIWHHFQNV